MQTHFVKVVNAFSVNGEIAPVGAIVELEASEAVYVLDRGLAEPATEADTAETEVPAAKK